ncbi:Hypothetical Protein XCAW_04260 [Xanthomonas citri subsp. citri Aw12879]|nr:Hypothetical Protein XCAW_04260 [Xanthomonas citri subsp. citri Aw12879]
MSARPRALRSFPILKRKINAPQLAVQQRTVPQRS